MRDAPRVRIAGGHLVAAYNDSAALREQREIDAPASALNHRDVKRCGAWRERDSRRAHRILHIYELRHVHVAVWAGRAVFPAAAAGRVKGAFEKRTDWRCQSRRDAMLIVGGAPHEVGECVEFDSVYRAEEVEE